MTTLNSEIRELSIEELNTVAGGTPFYGMRCSQNQHETIAAIANAFGSVPVIGGVLSDVVTAVGQAICS